MATGRGYLTPEVIPTAAICRRLVIPEDTLIIAAVSGALSELSYASNWQQFGAVTPAEMAQRMSEMFTEYLGGSVCMIGSVVPFATEIVPDGALLCDGATYQAADYPALFDVISSEYKSGATFVTPDLRGRVIMGVGPGFAFTADGGEMEHTLTIPEMPSHDHSIDLFVTSLAIAPGELPVQTDVLFNTVTGLTGGDLGHNNLQPFLVLRYCIIAK